MDGLGLPSGGDAELLMQELAAAVKARRASARVPRAAWASIGRWTPDSR